MHRGRQLSSSTRCILEDLPSSRQIQAITYSSELYQSILQDGDDPLMVPASTLPCEIDRLDKLGFAPLHWTVCWQKSKVLRALLEKRADPDIESTGRETPLFLAVQLADTETAELLLDFGANVNYSEQVEGVTPIFMTSPNPHMAQLLIDRGACIKQETSHGSETPLDFVARSSHDWELDDRSWRSWKEWFGCLRNAGADIDNQPRKFRRPPIMNAIWNRNIILVDLLVDAGCRFDLMDNRKSTLLHFAAVSQHLRTIEILRRAEISNINPDLPDADGQTPMSIISARLTRPEDQLDPGETQVTMAQYLAFKELISDIRMRYHARKLCLPEGDDRILCEDVASDSNEGMWGGSQWSDDHSLVSGCLVRSESGCDEFYDCSEEPDD